MAETDTEAARHAIKNLVYIMQALVYCEKKEAGSAAFQLTKLFEAILGNVEPLVAMGSTFFVAKFWDKMLELFAKYMHLVCLCAACACACGSQHRSRFDVVPRFMCRGSGAAVPTAHFAVVVETRGFTTFAKLITK